MSLTTTKRAINSKSLWIISPLWDMLYIVATPLLIVPLVYYLYQEVFRPEQIALAVMAFATLGHHLPGFMRAFGDRELFQRFKWRFLFMPPIIFATALMFSPTPSIQKMFDLSWSSLHGLEVVLFFWATWHGLMQTFGFMRIYDMKRNIFDKKTASLDWWLCLGVFSCGILFSQSRVNRMMELIWNVGLPVFDPVYLSYVRYLVGGVTLLIMFLYVQNMLRVGREKQGITWNKILLIATTGMLYWFTGRITTNLIIGVAMFEIFHAVQYDAIVWHYNRNLAKRVGSRFGKLGFLFRDRWVMLILYLAMIAAYGGIYYYYDSGVKNLNDLSSIVQHNLLGLISAIFITSTLLHYYYDGFIWKVREKETQQNLDITAANQQPAIFVPGLIHCSKWAAFYILVLGLLWLEVRDKKSDARESINRKAEITEALGKFSPQLPEIQTVIIQDFLNEGKIKEALQLAREVVKLRPRWDLAYIDLGKTLRINKNYQESERAYRKAILLKPDQWKSHLGLAKTLVLLGSQHWNEGETEYLKSFELSPKAKFARGELAWLYRSQKYYSSAIKQYELILKHPPKQKTLSRKRLKTQFEYLHSLLKNNEVYKAHQTALKFQHRSPDSILMNLMLGMACFRSGEHYDAIPPLLKAREGLYKFDLLTQVSLLKHLGIAYQNCGQLKEAKEAYKTALLTYDKDGELNYCLATLYLEEKNATDAREQLIRASQLGYHRANLLIEKLNKKP